MEPFTLASTIAIIFLTKSLEKAGEKFGEGLIVKMGQAIYKIRQHSPEAAIAIESGDMQVFNLTPEVLTQIPVDPIFAEFLDAANVEESKLFQQKLKEIQRTANQNPNKLAEKIGILVQDGGRVEIQEFKM